MTENIAEKIAIGQKCAELVNDGDTLFLGGGTTVLHAVKYLKEKKGLTVVTYSLPVAAELLFSHAGWLRGMLDIVLGLRLPRARVRCKNCTVAVFEYTDSGWSLHSWVNL